MGISELQSPESGIQSVIFFNLQHPIGLTMNAIQAISRGKHSVGTLQFWNMWMRRLISGSGCSSSFDKFLFKIKSSSCQKEA